jgi:hypothetical protein
LAEETISTTPSTICSSPRWSEDLSFEGDVGEGTEPRRRRVQREDHGLVAEHEGWLGEAVYRPEEGAVEDRPSWLESELFAGLENRAAGSLNQLEQVQPTMKHIKRLARGGLEAFHLLPRRRTMGLAMFIGAQMVRSPRWRGSIERATCLDMEADMKAGVREELDDATDPTEIARLEELLGVRYVAVTTDKATQIQLSGHLAYKMFRPVSRICSSLKEMNSREEKIAARVSSSRSIPKRSSSRPMVASRIQKEPKSARSTMSSRGPTVSPTSPFENSRCLPRVAEETWRVWLFSR